MTFPFNGRFGSTDPHADVDDEGEDAVVRVLAILGFGFPHSARHDVRIDEGAPSEASLVLVFFIRRSLRCQDVRQDMALGSSRSWAGLLYRKN